MAQQFTLEQVVNHNTQSTFDKYAVIHGEIYRLAQMPWDRCTVTPDMVTGLMMAGPDVSPLFPRLASGKDGSDLAAVKSATGSHIGTLIQAHAGAHHGQPEAQPKTPRAHILPFPTGSVPGQRVSPTVPQNGPPGAPPGQQGAPPGQQGAPPGQQGGHSPQGHGVQHHQALADAQREAQEKAEAEKKRREEARNRRLRKTYNPLKQDPDDADEYPADAVAMGYLPDLDARRWREKRMRLNRFIQFMDTQNIDDTDIDPTLSKYLHLDFANKIVYRRHLRGGEAKGCTGAFRASRPPPPRAQMRPRRQLPLGRQSPGPQDPRDSDDSDDDDDGGDGRLFAPVMGATEGRVRPWAASASNLPQQPTPPVTPAGQAGQNTQGQATQEQATQGQATQPPPRPPQDLHQLTPEQEQEIARRNRQKEKEAADKVLVEQAHQERLAAWAREGNAQNQANVQQQQQQQQQNKAEAERKKKQQDAAKKREELSGRKGRVRKAQPIKQPKTTKQPETSKQNQQLLSLKTAREEREQAEKKAEERMIRDKQQLHKEAERAKKQAGAASLGQHHHKQAQKSPEATRKQAEGAQKAHKELEAAEQRAEQTRRLERQKDRQEDKKMAALARKQKAAATSGLRTPVSGKYRDQVQRINELIDSSMTPQEAKEEVAQQDNGLVDSTGRIIQLPKGGGKGSGGGTTAKTWTPKTPGLPKTPENQKTPAATTPQGPSKRPTSRLPGGQGPGKKLQASPLAPTPAPDLALLYGAPPPGTTDPDDTVDIYNQPLPPGFPPLTVEPRSPNPTNDFYTGFFASMKSANLPNLMDVDQDDEDLIEQEFASSFSVPISSSSKATNKKTTLASQVRPAPSGPTHVKYTRVPEVRLPEELFPDYGTAGEAPKKFPPPGGIPSTKSSPDSGRVGKKSSSTAGSSLRSGKTRQTRQTRR